MTFEEKFDLYCKIVYPGGVDAGQRLHSKNAFLIGARWIFRELFDAVEAAEDLDQLKKTMGKIDVDLRAATHAAIKESIEDNSGRIKPFIKATDFKILN